MFCEKYLLFKDKKSKDCQKIFCELENIKVKFQHMKNKFFINGFCKTYQK